MLVHSPWCCCRLLDLEFLARIHRGFVVHKYPVRGRKVGQVLVPAHRVQVCQSRDERPESCWVLSLDRGSCRGTVPRNGLSVAFGPLSSIVIELGDQVCPHSKGATPILDGVNPLLQLLQVLAYGLGRVRLAVQETF